MSDTPPITTAEGSKPDRPSVHFDWRDWLPHVAEMDATDAEKQALIEALWAIVIGFVDLGWEVGSDIRDICGQSIDLSAALRSAMVDSKPSAQSDNTNAQRPQTRGDEDAA